MKLKWTACIFSQCLHVSSPKLLIGFW